MHSAICNADSATAWVEAVENTIHSYSHIVEPNKYNVRIVNHECHTLSTPLLHQNHMDMVRILDFVGTAR